MSVMENRVRSETATPATGRRAPVRSASSTGDELLSRLLQADPSQEPGLLQRLDALSPLQTVTLVKTGVRAGWVPPLASSLGMSRDRLYATLGLPRATMERRLAKDEPLSAEQSSRVLGIARLIGQVQAMLDESGTPAGFDAGAWVGRWLGEPVPALGGRCPAELMDTAEGQMLVANLLARAQSGAYA